MLASIIEAGLLRTVYQPVVDLDSQRTFGFEALTRGPAGSAFEMPDRLFGTARRNGLLAQLDTACRRNAISDAGLAGLRRPSALFVNCEPETLDHAALDTAAVDFDVVLELTERELTARPTELFRIIERARRAGWLLALDDVGADPMSLALIPLVRPDIVKLDLRLIQQRPSADIAAILNAVHADAERRGTQILAEGIETAEHLQTARAFGATLGQGWLLGRPAPLPPAVRIPPPRDRPAAARESSAQAITPSSPFETVAGHRSPRLARKPLLIEVSKHLEQQAQQFGASTVVLSALQHNRFFTPDTRRRYARLAEEAAFVGLLAEDMPAQPLPGIRGALLDATDPVIGEWDIAVVGPHFAACLVARDLGDTGPDHERRFEFVLSHDRELAVDVAISLMRRLADGA